MRNKRSQDVGVEHHEHPHQRRQREAVPEDRLEDRRFLALLCVATLATTMLWASIILPMTPPVLFAAAISTGLRPSCFGRHLLQVAEERVRAGVGAGQGDAEPAEQGAEERIDPARAASG